VKKPLANGANPNIGRFNAARTHYIYPIMIATERGNVAILSALLEAAIKK
jgi:hypothetical protein